LAAGSARRLDELVAARFDDVVNVVDQDLWSDVCSWADLVGPASGASGSVEPFGLSEDWAREWTATCRYGGDDVVVPVRDLASVSRVGREPVRRFSWHRAQRHRSGLQYMVSTGRHHGYESLEEARLLLMLDFAGDVVDVLSQPMRLRFIAEDGPRDHIPDFLAYTGAGVWLIDVRPAGRIKERDETAFAASERVASLLGWGYAVVTGWRPYVLSTVDTLSSQRRPLADRLAMADVLLEAVSGHPRMFGELAAGTIAPAIARAYLLHLLWHRSLRMDLSRPLTDRTLITAVPRMTGTAR